MKQALLLLLLGITFSAQAAVKKEERTAVELATIYALTVASNNGFTWTDYTCKLLLDTSLETAEQIINDKKNKEDAEIPKMSKASTAEFKVMELAAELFMAEATKDGFIFSESSCKKLMPVSIEAARNVIAKKKEKSKLVKLAAQFFLLVTENDGFVWSESSCKELMPASIEAARNVIANTKMGDGFQRPTLKIELTEEREVIELASKVALSLALDDGFVWTDYTCEQFMIDALIAAKNAINDREKEEDADRPKLSTSQTLVDI